MSQWEENTAKWYEQTMVYCTLCGRLIPKRFWVAEVEAQELVFCGPDCEQLYRTYWLPAQQENV